MTTELALAVALIIVFLVLIIRRYSERFPGETSSNYHDISVPIIWVDDEKRLITIGINWVGVPSPTGMVYIKEDANTINIPAGAHVYNRDNKLIGNVVSTTKEDDNKIILTMDKIQALPTYGVRLVYP